MRAGFANSFPTISTEVSLLSFISRLLQTSSYMVQLVDFLPNGLVSSRNGRNDLSPTKAAQTRYVQSGAIAHLTSFHSFYSRQSFYVI
jgi:hypothetical protein